MQQQAEMTRAEAIQRMRAKERLALSKFIDFPSLIGNPEVTCLAPNQAFCVSAHERLQGIEKGRQMGQSLGYALDSVLRAVNEPGSNGCHVSTDKWESEKKQKYCLRILDCMFSEAKEGFKLITESKQKIEIEGWDEGGIRSISTIDFLACRPPRGADKAGIYLHEGAHMPNIIEILKAAKGCTAHAGYIRMCGTHQGNQTEFYSIINNSEDENGRKPHKNWNIGHFPWWVFPGFCTDVFAAINEAWELSTEERVMKYGNWVLQDLFSSYSLEDFQEEFECIVLDAKHSFYSDALIKSCQPQTEDAIKSFWFEHVDCDGGSFETIQPALDIIDILSNEIYSGGLHGEWLWAMDVGRHKDTSEITIGHKLPFGNVLVPRVIITMNRMPFPKQEQVVRHLLKVIPIVKGFIDGSGIGLMLSEVLNMDYGQKAMPLVFTNEVKASMANGAKIRMQKRGVLIPVFPPLTRQIHAIKKKITINNNETYDVEANSKHHGDKFWSFAMFCALEDPSGFDPNMIFSPMVVHFENDLESRVILRPGDQGFTSQQRSGKANFGIPRPWENRNRQGGNRSQSRGWSR